MIDEFYKELFVNNKGWNTLNPNTDEMHRWLVIKSFVEEVSKSDIKILDVGCGRGWTSNLLSKYGNVLGIDPVASVIEYGRELYPNIALMALGLEDYCSLYPEEKYDLIVCTEVLEHIVEKPQFLKKIKNLLSSDGHLILSTPRKENQEEWIKRFGDPKQPVEDWISTDDLNRMFDDCGFNRISYKTASYLSIYQIHLLSV